MVADVVRTLPPTVLLSLDCISVPTPDVDAATVRYTDVRGLPDGQRAAVYELVRPEAVTHFDGRIDG